MSGHPSSSSTANLPRSNPNPYPRQPPSKHPVSGFETYSPAASPYPISNNTAAVPGVASPGVGSTLNRPSSGDAMNSASMVNGSIQTPQSSSFRNGGGGGGDVNGYSNGATGSAGTNQQHYQNISDGYYQANGITTQGRQPAPRPSSYGIGSGGGGGGSSVYSKPQQPHQQHQQTSTPLPNRTYSQAPPTSAQTSQRIGPGGGGGTTSTGHGHYPSQQPPQQWSSTHQNSSYAPQKPMVQNGTSQYPQQPQQSRPAPQYQQQPVNNYPRQQPPRPTNQHYHPSSSSSTNYQPQPTQQTPQRQYSTPSTTTGTGTGYRTQSSYQPPRPPLQQGPPSRPQQHQSFQSSTPQTQPRPQQQWNNNNVTPSHSHPPYSSSSQPNQARHHSHQHYPQQPQQQQYQQQQQQHQQKYAQQQAALQEHQRKQQKEAEESSRKIREAREAAERKDKILKALYIIPLTPSGPNRLVLSLLSTLPHEIDFALSHLVRISSQDEETILDLARESAVAHTLGLGSSAGSSSGSGTKKTTGVLTGGLDFLKFTEMKGLFEALVGIIRLWVGEERGKLSKDEFEREAKKSRKGKKRRRREIDGDEGEVVVRKKGKKRRRKEFGLDEDDFDSDVFPDPSEPSPSSKALFETPERSCSKRQAVEAALVLRNMCLERPNLRYLVRRESNSSGVRAHERERMKSKGKGKEEVWDNPQMKMVIELACDVLEMGSDEDNLRGRMGSKNCGGLGLAGGEEASPELKSYLLDMVDMMGSWTSLRGMMDVETSDGDDEEEEEEVTDANSRCRRFDPNIRPEDDPYARLLPLLVPLTKSQDKAMILAGFRCLTALGMNDYNEEVFRLASPLSSPPPSACSDSSLSKSIHLALRQALLLLPLSEPDITPAILDFLYTLTVVCPSNSSHIAFALDKEMGSSTSRSFDGSQSFRLVEGARQGSSSGVLDKGNHSTSTVPEFKNLVKHLATNLFWGCSREDCTYEVPRPEFAIEEDKIDEARKSTAINPDDVAQPDGCLPGTKLDKTDLRDILNLPEPQRAKAWLSEVFEPDPESEVLQVELWQAYQANFASFAPERPTAIASEVIKATTEALPGSQPQVREDGGKRMFVVKGLRVKDRTDLSEFYRCQWTNCNYQNSETPADLYRHLVRNHITNVDLSILENPSNLVSRSLPNSSFHSELGICGWKSSCQYRVNPSNLNDRKRKHADLALHARTHIPVYKPKNKKSLSAAMAHTKLLDDPEEVASRNRKAFEKDLRTMRYSRFHAPEDANGSPRGVPLLSALLLRVIARTVSDAVASAKRARRRIMTEGAAADGSDDESDQESGSIFSRLAAAGRKTGTNRDPKAGSGSKGSRVTKRPPFEDHEGAARTLCMLESDLIKATLEIHTVGSYMAEIIWNVRLIADGIGWDKIEESERVEELEL